MGLQVRVAIIESGANIIFECADRMFGGVAAVGVWGYKLEVNVLIAEGLLNGRENLLSRMWRVGAAPC